MSVVARRLPNNKTIIEDENEHDEALAAPQPFFDIRSPAEDDFARKRFGVPTERYWLALCYSQLFSTWTTRRTRRLNTMHNDEQRLPAKNRNRILKSWTW